MITAGAGKRRARAGTGTGENRVEHLPGHPAGECVLLARMVAAEKRDASPAGPPQFHLRAVRERRERPGQRVARAVQRPPQGLPGEPAEADDHAQARRDHPQFRGEPRRAGVPFRGGGLVVRRRAADRRDHPRAGQPLAVPGGYARLPGRQPATVQRREQEVAAAVAGEDAPGPVPAVRGGRQADDEDRRRRVAPAGDRPPPVPLVAEGLAADGRDLLPPRDQARAGPAYRLARGQLRERGRAGGEAADVARAGRHRGIGTGRILRPPGAGRYRTSDHAMPSRMSCSLTRTSAKPNTVIMRSSTRAPAPMTSARPGCMTPMAARCARAWPSSRLAMACTRPADTREWWIRAAS